MKKVTFALVLFVIFLDHAGIGLVYPIFSSMLFQSDYSFIDSSVSKAVRGEFLGLLLGASSIAAFFSGPILGAMSDQKGRRPLYLFSLLLGVIGYLFCMFGIWIKSIVVLILARFINGIAFGNSAVVSATIVDLSEGSNKIKNFGLYSMASGIGFAIGPFLGGWLAAIGIIVPFFLAGIFTLISLLLIYFLFKETNLLKKEAAIKISEGIRNLKKAFKVKNLRIIFLMVCFFCFGWSLFYEFLPVIWITDYGFSLKKVGIFFGFGSSVYALSSSLLIRPIVDRFKPFSIIFCSLIFMGLVMLLTLVFSSVSFIWVYLILINFLVALAFPTYTALVSDSVAKNAQGETLGILDSIQATAFGLSPLIAGLLLGINTHTPMLLGGISMLISAMLLMLRKKRPSEKI